MSLAHRLIAILYVLLSVDAEKSPPRNMPFLQLDFYHIKTPQLIGIMLGCVVFTITISTVIYLLYASGTLGRAFAEMAQDNSAKKGKGQGSSAKPNISLSPQFSLEPELYEHLLAARKKLPIRPSLPPLEGGMVVVKPLDIAAHAPELLTTCNGQPAFHESAYEPFRLWGWFNVAYDGAKAPWTSLDSFVAYLQANAGNSCHMVIIDKEFRRCIGLITLTDNDVANLSVRIGNIWVTPAFQGSKRSHQALVLIVKHLVDIGYRRIAFEVDERHVIARKFFQRCGFLHEATLRKHRIMQNRNSNTAVYVMLNSDWGSIESRVFESVALPSPDKKVKVANLPTAIDRAGLSISSQNNVQNQVQSNRRKKKNKKRSVVNK